MAERCNTTFLIKLELLVTFFPDSHFVDEEMGAQREEMACPWLVSQWWYLKGCVSLLTSRTFQLVSVWILYLIPKLGLLTSILLYFSVYNSCGFHLQIALSWDGIRLGSSPCPLTKAV